MNIIIDHFADDFDPHFKLFHELMPKKVRNILLVSTPYDAWILEEDCRLSEKIINEYRGLNLSNPPRLTWVSTAAKALERLQKKEFDMVITMPQLADMNAFEFGRLIKQIKPDLPVILLSQGILPEAEHKKKPLFYDYIDQTFVWSGNTDILVALIKSVEDRMNVAWDTKSAGIRVILFVEDSPEYLSSLLPIIYQVLVSQTQAVMEEGLNEEHRLLTMRARPKILLANNYEEATRIYKQFKPNILGVISDVRFPRNNQFDAQAGLKFLANIRQDRPHIPLLLASSEPSNAKKAKKIDVDFVDKNSPALHDQVRSFFLNKLGFGDFIFRLPNGREIGRASTLKAMERILPGIPIKSILYHATRNDFSRWLFARTEILLANRLRPFTTDDFADKVKELRDFLVLNIHARRRRRQKGVVANFDDQDFDQEIDFHKIGQGSMGGKARGIAFVSSLLQRQPEIYKKFNQVDILIPKTLVITTQGFETFIEENKLKSLAQANLTDKEVADEFLSAKFPGWIEKDLKAFLAKVKYPLAVRSSSLLEDARFRAYAGLYSTYMLPNDHDQLEKRLECLIDAIKLVYASTYFQGPRAFAKRVGQRTEEEQMAVIIQKLAGVRYGDYFYPTIAGVAQSHNFYPFGKMKQEEGIATIAMGLGKSVVEGERVLRFSPKYPKLLPQQSSVKDILENSQRYFYCLKMGAQCSELKINEDTTIARREVSDATSELPVKVLAGTYIPEEDRIRDTASLPGYKVLTFANLLKYNIFPLADILQDILAIGKEGMGCPIEIEFSVNLYENPDKKPAFSFLQLRPMTARSELSKVDILPKEKTSAFCFSTHALGNTENSEMADIIFVKPDTFDSAKTREIAREIGKLNFTLVKQKRKYLLVGPGRWGSADPWLGIPVTWEDISGVGAIVENSSTNLNADPSQGSHFFHNITTLGINYISITRNSKDFIDLEWLSSLNFHAENKFTAHIKLDQPFNLKVDGSTSNCVIFAPCSDELNDELG